MGAGGWFGHYRENGLGNRLYTAAVVVFWLASMTWLVSERILPPFFGGDAPATLVCNQTEPVAWRMEMDGRDCGVAVMQAVPGERGTKEVHSVLRLDGLSSPKSAPAWLRPMLASMRNISLSMRTRTTYDALNRLSSFNTDMSIDQIDTKIKLTGRINDNLLKLTVRVAGRTNRFEHPWPSGATLGGELTPTGRLLPLYKGRRWSHEVYSPFASPKQPMELVEAEVTEKLRPTFDGVPTDAWRVEYRSTEKTGSTDERRVRAILLVAEDGLVMQQQAFLLGSSVVFARMSPERSTALAEELLELDNRATFSEANEKPTQNAGPASPVED